MVTNKGEDLDDLDGDGVPDIKSSKFLKEPKENTLFDPVLNTVKFILDKLSTMNTLDVALQSQF